MKGERGEGKAIAGRRGRGEGMGKREGAWLGERGEGTMRGDGKGRGDMEGERGEGRMRFSWLVCECIHVVGCHLFCALSFVS